jgi:hypothetical protein
MKGFFSFVLKLAEIVFVRRSRGALVLGTGVLVFGLPFGWNFFASLFAQTSFGDWFFTFSSGGGQIEHAGWLAHALGIGLIALGLCLLWKEHEAESRKKVLVIEARGLRNWHGSPLVDAIPKSIVGRRIDQVLSVFQDADGDQAAQPERALRHFTAVPTTLQSMIGQSDRSDVTIVVGGLAPVPFLFALGAMIDDEGPVTLMDWDRHKKQWRQLDEADDNERFLVTGLEAVSDGAPRVAVSVSVSYANDDAGIDQAEPSMPRVRLMLPARSTAKHFSAAKQAGLAEQFLDVLIELQAKKVREVSLFLAVPASFAIRLGTLYDKKNHPVVEVNQFERGRFPWAVALPTSEDPDARIVWKKARCVAA